MNRTSPSIARLVRPAALLIAAAGISGMLVNAFAEPFPVETASLRPGDVAISQTPEQFPDAPYGVDPVVTGPVTKAFRDTQKAAGCDTAEWPNIPKECYPG